MLSDDTLQEPQPLRQEVLGPGVDQDLAAIEGHGGLEPGEAHLLGVVLGDEKERVYGERGVGAKVQAQARLFGVVGLELIELVVLLVLDLVLASQPEGLDRVDALSVQVDGEGDEGAVFLDDLAHAPVLAELVALLLKLDHDLRAAALSWALLDLEAAGAVAAP